jgi:hypothetical protein
MYVLQQVKPQAAEFRKNVGPKMAPEVMVFKKVGNLNNNKS